MTLISRLKDQARRHEQREEWKEAIRLYRRVLEESEREDSADAELGLYNRVGDLLLRTGDAAEAVDYYETAADRYYDAGLYNNAIALCNKALRYLPERSELYRKLGRLCMEQGFTIDARRWFLEFAERETRAGRMDESLAALEEFASLSNEPEVWALLGRQLASVDGRTEESIAALRRAHALHRQAGSDEAAADVEEEIHEIDPTVDLAEPLAEPSTGEPSAPTTAAAGDELEVEGAEDSAEPPPLRPAAEPAEVELDAPEESRDYGVDYGMVELSGSEPVSPDAASTDEETDFRPEAAAEPIAEPASDEAEAVPPLPLLEDDVERDSEEEYGEEAVGEDPAAEELEKEVAQDLAEDLSDVSEEDIGDLGVVELAEGAAIADDVEDVLRRAREHVAEGDSDAALLELEELASALGDEGRLEDALRVTDEMKVLAPEEVAPHQLRVEFAFRLGEEAVLIDAYLGLAEQLAGAGRQEESKAIHERVLELDPGNEQSIAALGRDAAPASADSEDYVDLAGLIRDDSPEETTRFVVEEDTPSGDEDADFAEMLSQFRTKVDEHVAVEDTASHYDLGLAFKEMGLIDEAISEFQTALQHGPDRLKVYEELGQCFMEKEQYNVAMKILSQAVRRDGAESELVGVYYHLGRCYEELGRSEDAREAYEQVMSIDIGFADVSERLSGL